MLSAMTKLFALGTLVLLAASNPGSFDCDFHSGSRFQRTGEQIHREGKCYDVYEHPYWGDDLSRTKTHRAFLRCAR